MLRYAFHADIVRALCAELIAAPKTQLALILIKAFDAREAFQASDIAPLAVLEIALEALEGSRVQVEPYLAQHALLEPGVELLRRVFTQFALWRLALLALVNLIGQIPVLAHFALGDTWADADLAVRDRAVGLDLTDLIYQVVFSLAAHANLPFFGALHAVIDLTLYKVSGQDMQ